MIDRQTEAYRQAVGWLYDRINYEKLGSGGTKYRFTLDRMRDLVSRVGLGDRLEVRPHSRCEHPWKPWVVHIAGTKGKGSTSTMVAALLSGRGQQVGLYTSPHLVNLEERFRVNGIPATPAQMLSLIDWVRPIVDEMLRSAPSGPSFFELTTAMAMEHFRRHGCDAVVLETGLGGRLDSTNVFQTDITAVTTIGLDHQHVLGSTLDAIAGEKAGIFKPGVPAISGVFQNPARDVIREKAKSLGIELREYGRDFSASTVDCATMDWGSQVRFQGIKQLPQSTVHLRLEGQHQATNAAVALAIVDRLFPNDPIPQSSIQQLEHLQLEARLERFDRRNMPTILLDAAHNPDSIAALVDVLKHRFAKHRKVLVFGTSSDKDFQAMLSMIVPEVDQIVLTRYHGNPRFVPVQELANAANAVSRNLDLTSTETPSEAMGLAIREAESTGLVVIAGSFFLAAELRAELVEMFGVTSEHISTG